MRRHNHHARARRHPHPALLPPGPARVVDRVRLPLLPFACVKCSARFTEMAALLSHACAAGRVPGAPGPSRDKAGTDRGNGERSQLTAREQLVAAGCIVPSDDDSEGAA